MDNPLKISVVVPVYNVEDYLEQCLTSISSQTYENFEAICVDDGSTDGSSSILKKFADSDLRFKVISQDNSGISSARNVGINNSTGDVVCFVDSDDWLENNAFEIIADNFNKDSADILTYGANCIPESSNVWLKEHLSPRNIIYDAFCVDVMFKEMSRPFPWRTACNLEFLKSNELYFDESLRFGEDQVWDFAIYPKATKIQFITDKIYNYRTDRPGSLMYGTARNLSTKAFAHAKIIDHVLNTWRQYGILGVYKNEMLEFFIDFSLYEFMFIDRDDLIFLIKKLSDVMSSYWTIRDISDANLDKSTKDLLLICYEGILPNSTKLKLLKLQYKLYKEGFFSIVRSIFRRL